MQHNCNRALYGGGLNHSQKLLQAYLGVRSLTLSPFLDHTLMAARIPTATHSRQA
jgi:hypothetical protein